MMRRSRSISILPPWAAPAVAVLLLSAWIPVVLGNFTCKDIWQEVPVR